MIIRRQRNHGMLACYSATCLLFLLKSGITSGLQQSSRTSSIFAIRRPSTPSSPAAFHVQTTCLRSTSVDQTLGDLSSEQDCKTKSARDWDEQFEALQSFMAEYGHCNFPQNPSEQLEKTYPGLKRFCRDQRKEKRRYRRRNKNYPMTLAIFDRDVRCRRLADLGFEFHSLIAQWYDRYHELVEHVRATGNSRVKDSENPSLSQWMYLQRHIRRRGAGTTHHSLSDSQIKLLDDIGFEWDSNERWNDMWNARYKEAAEFYNKHGHLRVPWVPGSTPLERWIIHQRIRRKGLTEEQIKLLDEISFPWTPEKYGQRWYDMYDELERYQEKHGNCKPIKSLMPQELYSWSLYQQKKHRQGQLSTEQIKLLEKINFPLERKLQGWRVMYRGLLEYWNTHGHLQVNEDDNKELYDWMILQRERYQGIAEPAITDTQIEQLEDANFCWSLDWRDRTWHEKFAEAAELFKEHGHVRVTKKENPSLYNWIQIQEKRYNKLKGQKPLSDEELEMLEQLDFPFLEGQPRMAWNVMFAEVEKFREQNDGHLPASHKDDPILSHWLRQQRHRYRCAYGYVALSEEQKPLLESIDFPRYPTHKKKRSWYEKYDELVDHWKRHGHFVVDTSESSLYVWIKKQRVRFQSVASTTHAPLSKFEVYLLERIGFTLVSDRYEVEWQERYDEVAEFLKAQGRLPTRLTNQKLSQWKKRQRARYQGFPASTSELSDTQIEQLKKIGILERGE